MKPEVLVSLVPLVSAVTGAAVRYALSLVCQAHMFVLHAAVPMFTNYCLFNTQIIFINVVKITFYYLQKGIIIIVCNTIPEYPYSEISF